MSKESDFDLSIKKETEATTMSEAPSGKTVGEELFLVHLSRVGKEGPGVDDLDLDIKQEAHNRTGMSVGDELWRVHCKRSNGMEFESDEDPAEGTPSKKKVKKATKVVASTKKSPYTTKVIHLRNRDVEVS